ncbi:MAG: class I SAM-dependent methyltransferase [Candidatus Sericytochromatia bacterium]
MKDMIKEKAIDYTVDIFKGLLISIVMAKFFPDKKKKEKIIYQNAPETKKKKGSKIFKIFKWTKNLVLLFALKEIFYNRIKAKLFKIKDNRDYFWVNEFPVHFVNLDTYIPEINNESTVLDLGAGTGYFSVKLAKHISKKGKVSAVDINKKALKQIQTLAKNNNISNLELHRADIQDLPFSKNYADHVFLNMSYGQIINKPKGLHEIFRVMNTGGKLYINEIMIDPFYSFSRVIIKEAKKAGFKLLEKKGNMLNYLLVFEKE